ncbi:MAG TPA: CapA family protein [Gemmatimonadales bacterium]|jgi:poly-gamma-glutamate synthesis protein (capsule biosynthesis protein)|nr:CapA family protein [Gemmatimonadales bacterium]
MRELRLLSRRCAVGLAQALALALPGLAPGAVAQPARQFSFALTGDAIITRRLSVYQEPEFLGLIDLLRKADASFTNLEMLFHDYEPWPMHVSGGTWMRADPALVKELVWAGFDLVSLANNHAGDYGVEGMRLTQRYVRAAGLVGAGTGENLAEAREAKFLETARGRVALISVASTFTPHSAASPPRGAVRGRPGLSPLRFSTTRELPRAQLERLRGTLRESGLNVPDRGDRFQLFGNWFAVGARRAQRSIPDSGDVASIAAVVRNARRLADYVLVTIHAHEAGGELSMPAEFLVSFARAMVDAGADLFVGHGPHVLRGIELYKGKPIFFSLGDFIFQNETVTRLPEESYAPLGLDPTRGVADFNAARYGNDTRGFPAQREVWESVVALPTFSGKTLSSLELVPITLGFGQPTAERGRPQLAQGELAAKILRDVAERSEAFGTEIQVRGGRGYVTLKR